MNSHLQNSVSTKTVKRELHAENIYGRFAILKSLVTATNTLLSSNVNGPEITKVGPHSSGDRVNSVSLFNLLQLPPGGAAASQLLHRLTDSYEKFFKLYLNN
ncbi:hypothetical protein TNCV_4398171 [Trichonephila clavipes]|nr:hypothetical protein TNCV_4398171 [Trichonephila clavipes]